MSQHPRGHRIRNIVDGGRESGNLCVSRDY